MADKSHVPMNPIARVHQMKRVEQPFGNLEADSEVKRAVPFDELAESRGHALGSNGLGGLDESRVGSPARHGLGSQLGADVRGELEDDANGVGVGVVVDETGGGREEKTIGLVRVQDVPLQLDLVELGLD